MTGEKPYGSEEGQVRVCIKKKKKKKKGKKNLTEKRLYGFTLEYV